MLGRRVEDSGCGRVRFILRRRPLLTSPSLASLGGEGRRTGFPVGSGPDATPEQGENGPPRAFRSPLREAVSSSKARIHAPASIPLASFGRARARPDRGDALARLSGPLR